MRYDRLWQIETSTKEFVVFVFCWYHVMCLAFFVETSPGARHLVFRANRTLVSLHFLLSRSRVLGWQFGGKSNLGTRLSLQWNMRRCKALREACEDAKQSRSSSRDPRNLECGKKLWLKSDATSSMMSQDVNGFLGDYLTIALQLMQAVPSFPSSFSIPFKGDQHLPCLRLALNVLAAFGTGKPGLVCWGDIRLHGILWNILEFASIWRSIATYVTPKMSVSDLIC